MGCLEDGFAAKMDGYNDKVWPFQRDLLAKSTVRLRAHGSLSGRAQMRKWR